ncbi:MAG: hypothetical protein RL684_2926 [Pseudomonadota bacterium]|jgi:hypothetical protein
MTRSSGRSTETRANMDAHEAKVYILRKKLDEDVARLH